MAISEQRKTALAVVEAFNKKDIATIMSHRSPDCVRYYYPKSMGYPPQDNESYGRSLHRLATIFDDFSLAIDEIVEDREARTMCLWLTAKAGSKAGLYQNDYVWLWDFDETGTKIVRSKEFSDAVQNKEFYPKLQAAMRQQSETEGAKAGGTPNGTEENSMISN